MSFRNSFTVALVTASVTIASSSCGFGCGASKGDVERMRRTLKTELPAGTSESQVITYLDNKRISHSGLSGSPDPKHRGLVEMGATIENYWHSEPTMYVRFYFDNVGKLVESDVTNASGAPEGY